MIIRIARNAPVTGPDTAGETHTFGRATFAKSSIRSAYATGVSAAKQENYCSDLKLKPFIGLSVAIPRVPKCLGHIRRLGQRPDYAPKPDWATVAVGQSRPNASTQKRNLNEIFEPDMLTRTPQRATVVQTDVIRCDISGGPNKTTLVLFTGASGNIHEN